MISTNFQDQLACTVERSQELLMPISQTIFLFRWRRKRII